MSIQINLVIIFGFLSAISTTCVLCQREPRRQSPADMYKDFSSPCGNAQQVSRQVGGCINEVNELIEGKAPYPSSDVELQGYCNRFTNSERCARRASKDCLTGLHKTVVGSVSSATKRLHQRVCKTSETRSAYVKPSKCLIKKGPEIIGVMRNHTAILQGLRDLPIPPEEKLIRMCCVLDALDKDVEARYRKECPQETAAIVGIIHALTDDSRTTLCARPRCNGALDKVIGSKYQPPQNLFEPVFEILFQISVKE